MPTMRHLHFSPTRLAAAAAILALAALAPAGGGVGLLSCLPVILASTLERRRAIVGVAAVAAGAFAAATTLLHLSGTPAWTVERLAALLAIGVAAGLSLVLHASRAAVVAGRQEAQSASEMNRLLVSLLAHDLRSPLVLADQGLQYVEESVAGGYPVDRSLVADLRARLQRSLRAIGLVLELARDEAARPDGAPRPPAAISLREEVGAEVASFRYEADVRGKRLALDLDAVPGDRACIVDALVLRQALAIALDNAIRYADPGAIHVRARLLDRSVLELRVEDAGPGMSAHRSDADRARGAGLGLHLCAALLERAGGSLRIESDSPAGTVVVIRLPASVAHDVPAPEARLSAPAAV